VGRKAYDLDRSPHVAILGERVAVDAHRGFCRWAWEVAKAPMLRRASMQKKGADWVDTARSRTL